MFPDQFGQQKPSASDGGPVEVPVLQDALAAGDNGGGSDPWGMLGNLSALAIGSGLTAAGLKKYPVNYAAKSALMNMAHNPDASMKTTFGRVYNNADSKGAFQGRKEALKAADPEWSKAAWDKKVSNEKSVVRKVGNWAGKKRTGLLKRPTSALMRSKGVRSAGKLLARNGSRLGLRAAAFAIPGPGWAVGAIALGATWLFDKNLRSQMWSLFGAGVSLDAAPERGRGEGVQAGVGYVVPSRTQYLPVVGDGDVDKYVRVTDESMALMNNALFRIEPWDTWHPESPARPTTPDFAATIDKLNAVLERASSLGEQVQAHVNQYGDDPLVAERAAKIVPSLKSLSGLGDGVINPIGTAVAAMSTSANNGYQTLRAANLKSRQAIVDSRGGLAPWSGDVDQSELTNMANDTERVGSEIKTALSKLQSALGNWKAPQALGDPTNAGPIVTDPTPQQQQQQQPQSAAPSGQAPSGQAPSTSVPSDQSPSTTTNKDDLLKQILTQQQRQQPQQQQPQQQQSNPFGQNPFGQNPFGQNQNPLGNLTSQIDKIGQKDKLKDLLNDALGTDKPKAEDLAKVDEDKPKAKDTGAIGAEGVPAGTPSAKAGADLGSNADKPATDIGADDDRAKGTPVATKDPEEAKTVKVDGKDVKFSDPRTAAMVEALYPSDGASAPTIEQAAADAGFDVPPPGQDIGQRISQVEMRPGDLIIGADHSGVFLGDGQVLVDGKVQPLSDIAQFTGPQHGIFRIDDVPAPVDGAQGAVPVADEPSVGNPQTGVSEGTPVAGEVDEQGATDDGGEQPVAGAEPKTEDEPKAEDAPTQGRNEDIDDLISGGTAGGPVIGDDDQPDGAGPVGRVPTGD